MLKTTRTRLFGCLALTGIACSVVAQEPTRVQVEGLDEVKALLQRLDDRLAVLASSRWEYRFVQRNRLGPNDVKRQVEALGFEGWELVNVTLEEGYVFKRRIIR